MPAQEAILHGTFDEYDTFTKSTDLTPENMNGVPAPVYYAGKLAGESGEVLEKVMKVYRDSGGVYTTEIRAALLKELGDCCWYISRLAVWLGFSMLEVAVGNVLKLMGRMARGTLNGSGDDR